MWFLDYPVGTPSSPCELAASRHYLVFVSRNGGTWRSQRPPTSAKPNVAPTGGAEISRFLVGACNARPYRAGLDFMKRDVASSFHELEAPSPTGLAGIPAHPLPRSGIFYDRSIRYLHSSANGTDLSPALYNGFIFRCLYYPLFVAVRRRHFPRNEISISSHFDTHRSGGLGGGIPEPMRGSKGEILGEVSPLIGFVNPKPNATGRRVRHANSRRRPLPGARKFVALRAASFYIGLWGKYPPAHNSISDNSTFTGGVIGAEDSSSSELAECQLAFSPSGSGFTGADSALFIISVNVAPGF